MSEATPLRDVVATARARYDGGDVDGARALLEYVLEGAQRAYGAGHPDVLQMARLLGSLYREGGDVSAARRVLEEAMAAGALRWPPDDPLMLLLAYDLGIVAQEFGNRHEARRNLELVVRLGPAVLGATHPVVVGASGLLDPEATQVLPEIGPEPPPLPGATKRQTVPTPATPPPTGPDNTTGPDHPTTGPDHRTSGPDHRTSGPDHPTTGPDDTTETPRSQSATAPTGRDATRQPGQPPGRPGIAPTPAGTATPVAEATVPDTTVGNATTAEGIGSGRPARSRARHRRRAGSSRRTRWVILIIIVLAVAAAVTTAVVVRAASAVPRQPPIDVHLTDEGVSITLRWRNPAVQVPVIVSGARAGEQGRPFAQLVPGRTSYTVHGLNPGLEYCFAVVAVYGAGEGTEMFAPSELVCTSRGAR